MEGIVIEQVVGESATVRELLVALDAHHQLHNTRFAAPQRVGDTDARVVRLVAVRGGRPAGFLAGNPRTGHIDLVGVLEERAGIGTALVEEFLRRARASGAAEATVVLDAEPTGRWGRRAFFQAHRFVSSQGSALHFHRRLR
ncbi:GNAT family N-acetyltransferase [Nocardia thailandica]